MSTEVIRLTDADFNHLVAPAVDVPNSHRFRWVLAMTALLSIVSGASALAPSSSKARSSTVMAQLTGVQSLSADELVLLVKSEKLVAYWLGPVPGSRYMLIANDKGIVNVAYLTIGDGMDNPSQVDLLFETVPPGNMQGLVVPPNTPADTAKLFTVTGDTFSYDPYITDHMSVQVKRGKRQVLVFYPNAHSLASMRSDAMGLKLIA